MAADKYVTRQTLLMRACNPDDHDAWDDFINYYQRFIYHILHKMNINLNEFDDLVQLVLVRLWKNIESYDRSKSKFRTWLSHVTRNTVLNYIDQQKRQQNRQSHLAESQDIHDRLNAMSETELETMVEKEWRAYVCTMALDNLRELFSGQAVDVFSLSQKDKSAAEIADMLGLKKESVYVLISRVKSKFVEEVKRLIKELEF